MRVKVIVEALVDAPDVQDPKKLAEDIERYGLGPEDAVAITKVTVEEVKTTT